MPQNLIKLYNCLSQNLFVQSIAKCKGYTGQNRQKKHQNYDKLNTSYQKALVEL